MPLLVYVIGGNDINTLAVIYNTAEFSVFSQIVYEKFAYLHGM